MNRTRTLAVGIAAAGMLTLGLAPAHAGHGEGSLTIGMNGDREVDNPGDPDASGNITLSFFGAVDNPAVAYPNEPYVCWDLKTEDLDGDIIGLHIHEADRRSNGPVVADLLTTVDEDGCVSLIDADTTIDELKDDPRNYYVNLHTDAVPSGAMRGQFHTFK